MLLFFLFPIYWLVNTSLKIGKETTMYPPLFWSENWTFEAYKSMFFGAAGGYPAAKMLKDSIIVSVASTFVSVVLGTMAAYGFSRFKSFITSKHFLFWILSTRMFPPVAMVLPLFLVYKNFGLLDTYLGLVITYFIFNLSFIIWVMKGFVDDIPVSLENAALLDGYSRMQVFFKITFPLIKPGIVAIGLLAWVFAWNEFLFAMVLTRTDVLPFPPQIPLMATTDNVRWDWVAAVGVMAVIPVAAVITVMQKYLVRGFSLGAVK
jgi:multiple sugar transport system permease protein